MKDLGFHPVLPHQAEEGVFALLGPAVLLGLGQAEHGEAGQADVDQVVARHLDQLVIVGCNVGNTDGIVRRVGVGAADADDRHAAVRQGLGHGGIVEIGDDAVALPAFYAGQAQPEIFFQEQVPGRPRAAQVGGNTGGYFSIETLIRIKQQGNPTYFRSHGLCLRFIDFIRALYGSASVNKSFAAPGAKPWRSESSI